MKKRYMIHRVKGIRIGKTELRADELRRVRVLACAEGWAMVRRKGSVPYVARESELIDPDNVAEQFKEAV